jgi:hypothetical protein
MDDLQPCLSLLLEISTSPYFVHGTVTSTKIGDYPGCFRWLHIEIDTKVECSERKYKSIKLSKDMLEGHALVRFRQPPQDASSRRAQFRRAPAW